MANGGLLLEKLKTIPCHFTWNLEFEDLADVEHLQEYLTLQVQNNYYHNRDTYLAMKAFLYHLQKRYSDALKSLQEAEKILAQDHPGNLPRQALLTYGNYAWIYYHLGNYRTVMQLLRKIYQIGHSFSSPQPCPSGVPEILAQKGWSLLVAGIHRGREAQKCFEGALRGDLSNPQLQAGLALAVYATWEHLQGDPDKEKATELLEEVVRVQPQNYEARVYLARLLRDKDEQRARKLLEDVVENSVHPEVLRRAAKVSLHEPQQLSQAMYILQKAIALDPNYHILYYDLGMCYKAQVESATPERKAVLQPAMIESFQKAVQMNALFVDPMLELAKIYGASVPAGEEDVYINLLVEEAAYISKPCQQALFLQWGDYLLHQMGQKDKALEKYMAGIRIASDVGKNHLGKRLMNLAHLFKQDSQTGRAEAIYTFLQSVHYEDPGPQSQELWWHHNRPLR
ncbi:hypothetical protein JRQ81_015502 [Phrynocephalus forsythii]|uniref:Interferon-induced protein with tetratricopeptide repeats 2-like n=1 Tax=Phrynocephalus forsythii TaxID=171643 RepID=A0A9Q1B234_9SAUR|nr:hypothetical protein JRQ81_015502 [Phrynocephalus forsythii]